MRSLIVILLLATSVDAQTLAEAARKERERQARTKSTRIITREGVQTPAPASATTTKPGDEKVTASDGKTDKPATPATAKPAAPVKPVGPDPAVAYNAQLAKLRARMSELQQQETELQLQASQLNNQVFAPVTDQASKDRALAQLADTNAKLTATRTELDQTRRTLDSLMLQGPPKQP